MKIKMTGISYSFDEEGNTLGVTVSYNETGSVNYLNANIYLTQENLDKGVTLDDLTRKEFDAKAREVAKTWFDAA